MVGKKVLVFKIVIFSYLGNIFLYINFLKVVDCWDFVLFLVFLDIVVLLVFLLFLKIFIGINIVLFYWFVNLI